MSALTCPLNISTHLTVDQPRIATSARMRSAVTLVFRGRSDSVHSVKKNITFYHFFFTVHNYCTDHCGGDLRGFQALNTALKRRL